MRNFAKFLVLGAAIVPCLLSAMKLPVQSECYGGTIDKPFIKRVKADTPNQLPPPPHLSYKGGPIISNARVVTVLWGSNVLPSLTSQLPEYVDAILQSPWIDWLCEYNTRGLPKPNSNQVLGRGKFQAQVEITPFNQNQTIVDSVAQVSDLHTELAKQLDAGHLPQPEYDSQGNPLTIYSVFFPNGVTIILEPFNAVSCIAFGAYHHHFLYKGKPVIYTVQPNCGDSIPLDFYLAILSHELAESITDPFPPPETVTFFPNGWIDAQVGSPNEGFEIADLCEQLSIGTVTVNGKQYPIVPLWSNSQNACIITNPNLASAPSIKGKTHVKVGEKIVLRASGAKGPFQWYHNGKLLEKHTHRTLKIKKAKKGNSGVYVVRGSCTAGSQPFHLEVKKRHSRISN